MWIQRTETIDAAETSDAVNSSACRVQRLYVLLNGAVLSASHVSPQLAYGEAQVLDKIMYEEEVRREVFAFEQQFHYAVRRFALAQKRKRRRSQAHM